MSIRVRIILSVMSIVLVISSSSMAIGIYVSRSYLLRTIENDMSLASELAAEMVRAKVELLKILAGQAAAHVRAMPEKDVAGFLKAEEQEHGAIFMWLLHRNGRILSTEDIPDDPLLVKSSYAQRTFAGESIVGSTEWTENGDFVIRVWTPVDEERILVVALPGMTVSDMVRHFRIWETGNIFILDSEGTVIAFRESSVVTEQYNFILLAEVSENFKSMAETVRRMTLGETGRELYAFRGVERSAAYLPIEGTEGWSLGVSCPISESPTSQVLVSFLISGGVFLGLGLLAAVLTASRLAKPFEKIREQNADLARLRNIAEAASEAKSDFLANMSHEMRTPLNAIIGFSELELRRQAREPSSARGNLEKIYSSGVTLLGLINDILDISKIESENFELIPVDYDTPSLINDTVALNAVRIGSKPIVFNLEIDENLPCRLRGDELRVKQVFNNLLSNAFKYTKEGSVTFKVDFARKDGAAWLCAAIRDTGIGIREEDLKKLFSDYNQVDTRRNRHIEGTGLGLAITRRLVKLMEGEITVKSEYGKGSEFRVMMRQELVDESPIGKELAENLRYFKYDEGRQDRHKNLVRAHIPYARVLVVDDVATNLDVARGMMEPYGMTVNCAASGEEAIKLIKEEKTRYHAVFMDHMMPGMDGIEALRIIRGEIHSEYAKKIPIIALTANAIRGNEEMFLKNGFQAFLSKPIDAIRLNEVIDRWVRDKEYEKKQSLSGTPAEAPRQETCEEEQALRAFFREHPVDGMDFSQGLSRFGNAKAYRDSLKSYVNHTPPLLEKLKSSAKEDLLQYGITVHGIKGSSYGVSAQEAGRGAEELEKAAKGGDIEFVRAHTEEFLEHTAKLIAALSEFLEAADAKKTVPGKPAPDPGVLRKICEAAGAYDMEGMDEAMEELEKWNYESGGDIVPWLRERIDSSEFDEIAKRLAETITLWKL